MVDIVRKSWNQLEGFILEAYEVMAGAKAPEKSSAFVPLVATSA